MLGILRKESATPYYTATIKTLRNRPASSDSICHRALTFYFHCGGCGFKKKKPTGSKVCQS